MNLSDIASPRSSNSHEAKKPMPTLPPLSNPLPAPRGTAQHAFAGRLSPPGRPGPGGATRAASHSQPQPPAASKPERASKARAAAATQQRRRCDTPGGERGVAVTPHRGEMPTKVRVPLLTRSLLLALFDATTSSLPPHAHRSFPPPKLTSLRSPIWASPAAPIHTRAAKASARNGRGEAEGGVPLHKPK